MKCKKLIYKNHSNDNNTLLGIIIFEDQQFLHFRTANKKHIINKSLIMSISDTNEEFVGDEE
jgi:hypothetical protein